nr:unnamed protein product [Callosobruchus analis]
MLTEKLESKGNIVKKKVFSEKDKASEDHPRKKLKHKLSASKGFTDSVNNVACPLCREHYSTSEWIRCDSCATWWYEECTQYSGFGEFVCDFC